MADLIWIDPPELALHPEMAGAAGGHPLVAKILAQRGINTPQAVQAFFDPVFYNPAAPAELPGLDEAAARLEKAIQKKEPICVWGDFDVDGQTSTTLLVAALRELGGNVSYHIPLRESESHGVHLSTLQPIIEQGVGVLLTCDTGISASAETDYARQAGVDVIITDHHDLPAVLPQAYAIVNPKMLPAGHPLANLPGVGVAYKLAEELYRRAGRPEQVQNSLDLAALGIVADLAILKDDTRYLLQLGLPRLRLTPRLGLRMMMEMAELNPAWLSEEHISFVLAPRLNALGRLADANTAVEFFTTQDPGKARQLAVQLEGLNQERKLLTDQVYAAAEAQIARDPALLEPAALVLSHPAWPAGVIGIVASRLVDRYNRPVVLFSAPALEMARGSARSIETVNISAAIADLSGMLAAYGGHPMAAGLSLPSEKIPQFRAALSATIQRRTGTAAQPARLQIDGSLPLSELSLVLVDDLERLGPFGPGNPALTLCSPDMLLTQIASVGRSEEHLQMVFEDRQGNAYRVIYWQAGGLEAELKQKLQHRHVDLAYHARASDYYGQRRVQVEFVDARLNEPEAIEVRSVRRLREVIDCRKEPHALWLLRQAVSQSGAMVWAEADAVRKLASQGLNALDRYNLSPSASLAVWTSPPGQSELQSALEQVNPRSLYLFGVDPETRSFEDFLSRLAGLIKYALKSNAGKTSLRALAGATAQHMAAVLKGLAWLESRGHIQVLSIGEDEILVGPGVGHAVQVSGDASPQKRAQPDRLSVELNAILAESAAFRAYFARADKDDLINPG